jgi:hypothetical protein
VAEQANLQLAAEPVLMPQVLSREEVAYLIDAAQTPVYRILLMTLYATGARRQRLVLRGHEYGDNFDVPKVFLTLDGKELVDHLEMGEAFNFTIVLRFDDGPEVGNVS